jgi:hypothetical protein
MKKNKENAKNKKKEKGKDKEKKLKIYKSILLKKESAKIAIIVRKKKSNISIKKREEIADKEKKGNAPLIRDLPRLIKRKIDMSVTM